MFFFFIRYSVDDVRFAGLIKLTVTASKDHTVCCMGDFFFQKYAFLVCRSIFLFLFVLRFNKRGESTVIWGGDTGTIRLLSENFGWSFSRSPRTGDSYRGSSSVEHNFAHSNWWPPGKKKRFGGPWVLFSENTLFLKINYKKRSLTSYQDIESLLRKYLTLLLFTNILLAISNRMVSKSGTVG